MNETGITYGGKGNRRESFGWEARRTETTSKAYTKTGG
jgi:hypothetical protein